MIKLTNLARVISTKKTTRLIWHKTEFFDLISDGIFAVKIYKKNWPKSLTNKLQRKFETEPEVGQCLMSFGDKVSEYSISELLDRLSRDDDMHKLIDTNLIQHMPAYKVNNDDLYARILQSESELVFINNELFNIVDCKDYNIYGSSAIKPVFISESDISNWEVLIMPVRIGEINRWVNENVK